MLAAQRQSMILEQVRQQGGVRVASLVTEFGVSDMTIRRDLDVLARRGLVEKVYGGATARRAAVSEEPRFAVKSQQQPAEKQAIAEAAAELVRPGDAIGLSGGSTTHALAHALVAVPRLTVVTNSPPAADVFHERGREDQTVVLTGGVRTPSDALVGPFASATLEMLNLDLVFMGTHGMDLRSGFSTPNIVEADTNRALLRAARRAVFVADHTKWGMAGVATVAPLSRADVLITDEALPEEARAEVVTLVGDLILVATGQAPRGSSAITR